MKIIKIIITLLTLSIHLNVISKTTNKVSHDELESYLGKIYLELKCDFDFMFSEAATSQPKTCLRGIRYNVDKESPKIIFSFDTPIKDNSYLKNFSQLNKTDRQLAMLDITKAIAIYTGILPIQDDIYVGIMHNINKSIVINNSIVKENKKIREFIIQNSIVAVYIYEDGLPAYLTYLTPDGKYVYQEGQNLQIDD